MWRVSPSPLNDNRMTQPRLYDLSHGDSRMSFPLSTIQRRLHSSSSMQSSPFTSPGLSGCLSLYFFTGRSPEFQCLAPTAPQIHHHSSRNSYSAATESSFDDVVLALRSSHAPVYVAQPMKVSCIAIWSLRDRARLLSGAIGIHGESLMYRWAEDGGRIWIFLGRRHWMPRCICLA